MGRGTFHFPVPKDVEVVETVIEEKSDEEIEEQIKEKFKTIDTCIRSVATGITKSLIISGPAGCGKSQETRNILTEMCEDNDTNFVFVSGKSSATGLYKLLYTNRFENCVTVLDDTDSIFFNEDSLNILKKVCDLGSNARTVSWLTETKLISEDEEVLPKSFDYEGCMIFITNYNFDELIAKGSKLSPHLEAFVSRGLYISAGLETIRERMIQIKLKLREGMLHNKGFNKKEEDDIFTFMEEHANNLREVSLRMCVKISSIMRIDHINWKNIVRETCFKR
jgi:hypothetical protein